MPPLRHAAGRKALLADRRWRRRWRVLPPGGAGGSQRRSPLVAAALGGGRGGAARPSLPRRCRRAVGRRPPPRAAALRRPRAHGAACGPAGSRSGAGGPGRPPPWAGESRAAVTAGRGASGPGAVRGAALSAPCRVGRGCGAVPGLPGGLGSLQRALGPRRAGQAAGPARCGRQRRWRLAPLRSSWRVGFCGECVFVRRGLSALKRGKMERFTLAVRLGKYAGNVRSR